LRLRADATFANFVATAANGAALHALRDWLARDEGGLFYLAGAPGCGRSHLLQAACHGRAGEAIYLPLAQFAAADPAALLENLEQAQLLCLDDIDVVTADPHLCEQLLLLCNRLLPGRCKLLLSAAAPAAQIPCALADLRSRLSWGAGFRLQPLDDDGRRQLLHVRARERGFEVSDGVATYILNHCARGTGDLLQLLDLLDRHSLARQRRITIPFVRECIEQPG
jgi:DnaA family protein